MNRTPKRTIQATFWMMVALQTIGTVDTRKRMPAPRQFVAAGIVWGILVWVAEMGTRAGRLAAQFSWLVLLTAMVTGPFGARLVSMFNSVASRFSTPGPPGTGGNPFASQPSSPIGPATTTAGFSPAPVAPEPGVRTTTA